MLSNVLFVVALCFSLYNFYSAGFWPLPSVHHSVIALSCGLFLCFMTKPLYKNVNKIVNIVLNIFLVSLGFMASVYVIVQYNGIIMRWKFVSNFEYFVAIVIFILILEGSRRTIGMALPILVFVMYAYALLGPVLPEPFIHPGFTSRQIFQSLFLTMQGYWGVISNVTTTVVPIFIIFGAMLLSTKGGDIFIKISRIVAGSTVGGGGKAAVVASALFGTISGATVANCAATGSITIPMMKKLNYKPYFAAAVEATASAGGQIMPPIMGAGAFIMAELLAVPYATIIRAALVPAILYFFTVFMPIHFEAIKSNLGKPKKESFTRKDYLNLPLVIIPIFVLLYVLIVMARSAPYSAFVASLAAIAYFFIHNTNIKSKCFTISIINNIKTIGQGLVDAANGMLTIIFIGFAAQTFVCLVNFTGFGLVFTNLIITLAGNSLFLALILTAITTIILGMGLPTVAAYLLSAAILAPALTRLGIYPLAAHMFIFYYAVLAAITPPVCPAVFVTAGIANADWVKTAIFSVKLGITAFIVPFMFIYSRASFLEGETGFVLISVLTAFIGCGFLASAVIGYLFDKLNYRERIFIFIFSILLIYPHLYTDIIGIIILVMFSVLNYKRRLKNTKHNEIVEIKSIASK